MDDQVNAENGEKDQAAPDYATRRIEPDELFNAIEKEIAAKPEAATEILTQAEDPAATIVVKEIPEASPAKPAAVEPPSAPEIPAPPVSPATPDAPKKDNRMLIAIVAAVTLVVVMCICACTIIAVAAISTVPNM